MRNIIIVFLLLVASAAAQSSDRPNILLIFTDDHGSQAISAYGSKVNKTPNIDRLANEGMRFDRNFCTNGICAPSRAVILTGLHSHRNGHVVNGQVFNGAQQTFPKLLRKAGYQTAMIGKWHLKSRPTGFDHYEVLIGQGPYYNPKMRIPGGERKHVGYTTDIVTDLSLEWMKSRDDKKPFMLMMQHKAPHRNWQPGPKYLSMYDDVTIPEPATLFDDYGGRGSASRDQEMTIAKHLTPFDLKLTAPRNLTREQKRAWDAAYQPKNAAFRKANLKGRELVRWKYQRYVKDYLRCVASVDDNIGRMLAYLDESGLAKNTVVIYSSDQGWYLGEQGWYDKRWMYEVSFRMPLIVRWPGVAKPGSTTKELCQNLDFAPTFLDMAGVSIPKDHPGGATAMQGRSLVPILQGKTPSDWRKSIYYHYYEHPGAHMVRRHYGVRTGRLKLIHFYRIGEWELYDLEKDPDELQNLYDHPSYRIDQAELHAELERLRRHYRLPQTTVPDARDAIIAVERMERQHEKGEAAWIVAIRQAARVPHERVVQALLAAMEPAPPRTPMAELRKALIALTGKDLGDDPEAWKAQPLTLKPRGPDQSGSGR